MNMADDEGKTRSLLSGEETVAATMALLSCRIKKYRIPQFGKACGKRSGCLRGFDRPNTGFAEQRPGLAKCGGGLPWE
ncbi:MAG: hypothetical protein LBL45_03910 [Treponema sp.]|nr:hypothetical protein [Treponema sp.]